MSPSTRRRFLRTTGVVVTGSFAGCGGNDGGSNDGSDGTVGTTISGDQYPDIDEWLTETSVGDATDVYDGTLENSTDSDTVTVDVGAAGNDGNFAFDPAGIVVSTDTDIEWSWTGQGNPHNVEAQPGEQLGRSDYTFTSGQATGDSGVQYTQTMDTAGVALYHCDPHVSLGMKGGIAIQE